NPQTNPFSPGLRLVDGLFQIASTRTAGFSITTLGALHPAVQVSFVVMMYISAFPIAIAIRKTNVYEEKSLGIYDDEDKPNPHSLASHIQRQLGFDLWYVMLGFFLISVTEGKRIQQTHGQDVAFSLFPLLFEIVSAYGTVGLSLGYPATQTSLSAEFNPVSDQNPTITPRIDFTVCIVCRFARSAKDSCGSDCAGRTRNLNRAQSGVPVWTLSLAFPEPSALDKRPGPVLVAVPKDADRVVKLINQSQRPVTCAGNGVHSSYDGPALLSQVAEQACIPVATTLLGLGSFDETHNLALHMMGTYGTPYANYERATGKATEFAPKARSIVQLDINADTVGKVIHPTDLAIGDLSVTLQILLPQLVRHDRAEWLSQIQHWKAEYSLRIPNTKEPQQYSLPQQILTELGHQIETIKHRTIPTAGVGQPQMWAAQRYRWRYSRSLITSGSLGAMGFGLPAAIGAHLAKPDHLVIDVDGDASLCMTIEELLTASQYDIPVKVVLFNNRQQAMITQLQQKDYNGCVCHPRQANPDFVRLAQSTGCQGRQCFRLDTLPENMEWLLNCEGPATLDVIVEDIDMKPIVSTGGSLDKVELELRLRARVIVKHSFS
ncbi:hypothetical protein ETB97_006726, partial [Aspergillus alliaceus]